jgi:hypothetical protein
MYLVRFVLSSCSDFYVHEGFSGFQILTVIARADNSPLYDRIGASRPRCWFTDGSITRCCWNATLLLPPRLVCFSLITAISLHRRLYSIFAVRRQIRNEPREKVEHAPRWTAFGKRTEPQCLSSRRRSIRFFYDIYHHSRSSADTIGAGRSTEQSAPTIAYIRE